MADYKLIEDMDIESQRQAAFLSTSGKEQLREKNIQVALRQGFIRKVYSILSMQLAVMTFMCYLSMQSTSYFKFQVDNFWLIITSFIITLFLPCFTLCCPEVYRKLPTNYILLAVFTFFESYIVSFVCALTSPKIVVMAAVMTLCITLALTVYALTTKRDFTLYGSSLFILGTVLLLFGIFLLFTQVKVLHIALSCLWTLLFAAYLVFDTQLIIGQHTYQLEIDDYILASFILYVDIVGLFINLLEILNLLNRE